MKAGPAYVEELDENDQILPGTRRTARAPTTEQTSDKNTKKIPITSREVFHQSEVKTSDKKPEDKINKSPKRRPISIKVPAPVDIPPSKVYPATSMAGNYNSYYYRMPPPPHDGPHQYFHPHHDPYGMVINEYPLPPVDNYAMSREVHGPPPPSMAMPMSGYYQYPPTSPTAMSYHPPHSPPYGRFPALPPQDYIYPSHQEYAYPSPQEYSYPPPQEYSYPPPQEHSYPPQRSTSRSLAARFQVREQPWDRSSDPITRTASAFGTRDFPRQRSRTLEEG